MQITFFVLSPSVSRKAEDSNPTGAPGSHFSVESGMLIYICFNERAILLVACCCLNLFSFFFLLLVVVITIYNI